MKTLTQMAIMMIAIFMMNTCFSVNVASTNLKAKKAPAKKSFTAQKSNDQVDNNMKSFWIKQKATKK